MKIISKFHDYYDNALLVGHDHSISYVRNHIKVELDTKLNDKFFNLELKYFQLYSKLNKCDYGVYPFKILFCGILYKGFQINTIFNCSLIPNKTFYIYDDEILTKFLNENQIQFGASFQNRLSFENRTKRTDFLKNNCTKEFYELCIDKKWIAVLFTNNINFNDTKHCLLNPNLKQWEFFRVFDSYSAYQELDMFIGGILPRLDNATINITDKDRIQQHGFDKWSFRKMPHE